ncbi:MAG: DUF3179 domain-containing protein [Anaerolineales bacterium]
MSRFLNGRWLAWLSLIVIGLLAISQLPDRPRREITPSQSRSTAEQAGLPTDGGPLLNVTASGTPLECSDPFNGIALEFSTSYWDKTDFCKHSVDYRTIRSGGPPPDGIPAIDKPVFESISAGDTWLGEDWPVLVYEHDGDARAYPMAILIWHEIVNDTVGVQPVAVTFCPLCNSSIVFSRRAPDGRIVDFGTSGNLRNSDLIMYDRQTESWWQQLTGRAIVGAYSGAELTFLPSQILAWDDFKSTYPDGLVLSRDTGHSRSYGQNPYGGYDRPDNRPFLFHGFPDERLPPMERVVTLQAGQQAVAYPFSALQARKVINGTFAADPVVVFWQPGVKSALDSGSMENSRDVGSAAVYLRTLGEEFLTFLPLGDGRYQDRESRTTWTFHGLAIDGPLAGRQLEKVMHGEPFWFAWAAFLPGTQVWSSAD